MKRLPGSVKEHRKLYVENPGFRDIDCPIHVLDGCHAVLMVPTQEKSGEIYLPDEVKVKYRGDVGWYLGGGMFPKGTPVVVRYGTGKRIDGFRCKGWAAGGKLVFLGWAGGSMVDDTYGDPVVHPFRLEDWEVLVASFEGNEVVPTGKNVLLRLTKCEKIGDIVLSDGASQYECDAEVVSVGPKVDPAVKPGMTAMFYDGLLTFIGDGLALCPEEGLMAVYD